MSLYSRIAGIVGTFLQIGGPAGPGLNANAGALETRNAANSAFAVHRGATPVGANDLATKAYVDAGDTGGGVTVNDTNGLRLTLTSGVGVTTADVTGAGTIYWTPFKSNQVSLFISSAWTLKSTSEIAFPLTVTSGTVYDLFAFWNGSVVAVEQLAWSTTTTRAVALGQQDGVWVKSTDPTRRYIGTFYANATNQTEDSLANRLLYNFYHQQPRKLAVQDSTSSWSYTTAAWRQAQGTAPNHQFTCVLGMPWERVEARVSAMESASSAATNMSVAVGVDSTTSPSADCTIYGSGAQNSAGLPTTANYDGVPGIGFHTVVWLEWGAGGGQFYGNVNSLGSEIAGMMGRMFG